MHRKYVEKNANTETLREIIWEIVPRGGDTKLPLDVIAQCLRYHDVAEDAFWAKYFEVANHQLPSEIQQHLAINQEAVRTESSSEIFHSLSIHSSRIAIVDNSQSFQRMLNLLLNNDLVAFDTEFKPIFSDQQGIALLQIAIRERVFLVDPISANIHSEDWAYLGEGLPWPRMPTSLKRPHSVEKFGA